FLCHFSHLFLYSFPTRRSSDLFDFRYILSNQSAFVKVCKYIDLFVISKLIQWVANLGDSINKCILIQEGISIFATESLSYVTTIDRKSTRLNSVTFRSRMPSSD